MPVSEATYERVALEDPEGQWGAGLRTPVEQAGHDNRA